MTEVTQTHTDLVYDAIEIMKFANETLHTGQISENGLYRLGWLLGSHADRLGAIIDILEGMERQPDGVGRGGA